MSKEPKNYDKLTPKLMLYLAAPHTWTASVFPAVFGGLYGFLFVPEFSLWKAVLLVIACVALNSAANVFNDYFDFVKGTDTKEDNVEENDSVLVYNNLNPSAVKRLAYSFAAAGVILGSICAIGAGFAPFILGVIGVIAMYCYSGGKTPICYLPFGEITCGTVIGGLIPLGAVSCFDGKIHPEVLLFSLPFIIGVGLMNMSNHGCDIEKDIKAGRKTLPILLGRPRILILYRTLYAVWIASAILISFVLAELPGLIASVIWIAAGSKFLFNFIKLRLEPVTRVRQLKGIVKSSYFISASLLVALLVKIIIGCL